MENTKLKMLLKYIYIYIKNGKFIKKTINIFKRSIEKK